MYTMNDFIEKKIAVSFANRGERIKFLKMCQKAGLRWRGGQLPTDSLLESCLNGRQIECGYPDKREKYLTLSNVECHKSEGWKTVPFSEFLLEETIGVIKRNGNTITVHIGNLHGTAKCSRTISLTCIPGANWRSGGHWEWKRRSRRSRSITTAKWCA